ncbi:MAG: sigma-70 family RNA polymerase sigma factor [Phycisphaerales bacterium]|nr:sigma-70 family RNA polymerase sigma factor [Phycisphaerales bacterium]
MMPRTLHLRSAEPGGLSCTIAVEDATLGRGSDCHGVVGDESVSRQHVRIRCEPGDWVVRDLGSTHGTFVNGVRVDGDESVPLRAGDGVRLGNVEFLVELEGPGFSPPPAPPPRPEPSKPSVSREEFQTRGSLLLRLGDGDSMVRELSWQAFHDQYAPIIRGFARNAGCPEAMREDLAQEVMCGFFKAAARFEYTPSRGRFRGYLKTATVHALQRMRHKRRGERQWTDEQFLEQVDQVDCCWDREWLQQALARAIKEARAHSRLTAASWDAFELYGRRGVPLAAAADQLGMTEAAVQKAKSRVAMQVREELERIRQEEG